MKHAEWCFVALLAACGGAQAVTTSSMYVAENAECVTYSANTAQAEACVSLVEQKWCGDGGLATNADSGFCKDGGK